MQRDRLHAAPAVLGLGLGLVVGIRVDIVGIWAALLVRNELNPGDTDVVRGQERLPGRNERVLEAWDGLEVVGAGDGRPRLAWLLDVAASGGAKFEALGGAAQVGVEQLAANELDARYERLGRLDVALDEHDPVDGVLKGFGGEMFL